MVLVFNNVEERSKAKNYGFVTLLYVGIKSFEKLLNNRLDVAFILISSMVLGLLHQQQNFWQLYLMELPGLLTGLRLLQL